MELTEANQYTSKELIMKTEWDYTSLASAYLKRPDYSEEAIDQIMAIAGVAAGDLVYDIGAGVARKKA